MVVISFHLLSGVSFRKQCERLQKAIFLDCVQILFLGKWHAVQGDKRDLYLAIDLGDIGAQALGIRKDGDRIFALLNTFFKSWF